MSSLASIRRDRRHFLKFIAGSPLLMAPGFAAWAVAGLKPLGRPGEAETCSPVGEQSLIQDPQDAGSVFDFEPVAARNVPPAHFQMMASGAGDEVTLRANREAFLKYYLRPHRLHDVSAVDIGMEMFGVKYDSPIFVCPTGGNRMYHKEGEVAVVRAAKVGNHLQILATGASISIEAAMEARGGPVWFQLYPTSSRDVAWALVRRAEQAGAPAVVVTVDANEGRRQVDNLWGWPRACSECHGRVPEPPNLTGIDMSGVTAMGSGNLTWDFVGQLREVTRMKVLLKGIVTAEDAARSVDHGVDGIVVSTHGGRAHDNGRGAIDCLGEVVAAVNGRIPVLVDSGFRRGADIVKALAMGANAVGIGRPYLWGLGAFGQPGVERVLELLRIETAAAMRQCGARSINELTPEFVGQF